MATNSKHHHHHAKKKALPPQPAMFRLHSPVIPAATGNDGGAKDMARAAEATAAGDAKAANRWPSPPPPAVTSGDTPSVKSNRGRDVAAQDPPPAAADDRKPPPAEKKKESEGGSDEDSITGEINRYYSEPEPAKKSEPKKSAPPPGGVPDKSSNGGGPNPETGAAPTKTEAAPPPKIEKKDETTTKSSKADDDKKDEAKKNDTSYLDDSDDEGPKLFPKVAEKRPRNSASAEAYAKRMAEKREAEQKQQSQSSTGGTDNKGKVEEAVEAVEHALEDLERKPAPARRTKKVAKKKTPVKAHKEGGKQAKAGVDAAPKGAPRAVKEELPPRKPSARARRSTVKASEAAEASGGDAKSPPEEIAAEEAPATTKSSRKSARRSAGASGNGLKSPPEEDIAAKEEAPDTQKSTRKSARRSAGATGDNLKSPPEEMAVEEAPKRATRKSAGSLKSPPEEMAEEPKKRASRVKKEAMEEMVEAEPKKRAARVKKEAKKRSPPKAKAAKKAPPKPAAKAKSPSPQKGGKKRKASVVAEELVSNLVAEDIKQEPSSNLISADIKQEAVVEGKRTRKPSLAAAEVADNPDTDLDDDDPEEDYKPPAKRSRTAKKSPAKTSPFSRAHTDYHRAKKANTWNERIVMLKAHRAAHGSCDLTDLAPGAPEVPGLLRSFVLESRKQYKKFRAGEHSTLTAERVAELDALGFDFAPLESGGCRANHDRRFQRRWDGQFAELEAYRAEHGDCLVSCVAKGPLNKLGNWVRGQRKLYNKVGREGFPPHRLARLDAIGFDFDPVRSGSYITKKRANMFPRVDGNWNRHFSNLRKYKEEHGNIIVGPNTEGAAPGLYDWIHAQRKEYKKLKAGDEKALMYDTWVAKLDGIGFDWAPMKNDGFGKMLLERQSKHFNDKWTGHYEDLKEFKKKHGHCYISRQAKDEEGLASWIHVQRKHKRKHDFGKKTPLTAERIKLLDDIGLDWAPSKSGGSAKIRQNERDDLWEGVFQKLVSFKNKCGHANPKKATPQLGSWCCRMRKLYAQNANGETTTLTDEKIAKLESIGFRFVSTQASV